MLSEVATKPKFKPQSERLMNQVREVLRYHHYAIRTEEAYVRWILAFIRFHGRKHPGDMGKTEIETFLSDLAVNGNCARSTQSQALNSIVFLYKQVLRFTRRQRSGADSLKKTGSIAGGYE